MNAAYWLNSGWMWSCRGEARAFRRAMSRVADTQSAVLHGILRRNRRTEFGTRHRFGSIVSPADYQRRVPISTYESYASSIRRIAAGKQNVLTSDRVELLEPTSGSTAGEKWIPYTASLRAEFQRAIAAWVADVMSLCPAVRQGRAYWSISPALTPPRRTAGGVPIGFDSDAAYLSRWQRFLVEKLLVTPPAAATLTNMDDFRYFTLYHLLAASDLSLISIWSPTFLTALVPPLQRWSERICDDLRRGRLSLPSGATSALTGEVRLNPRQRRRRADQLADIFHWGGPMSHQVRQLWPRLGLISCWADASAATYLPALKAMFPNVSVQPKGLLSTEACVSLPLCGHTGAALALRSHFFEFRLVTGDSVDEAASPLLAHRLEIGSRYDVIVTTGGGLYRYRLGDVVEVTGYEKQCPLLRFVGRRDRVSDLVGEKLAEPHVLDALDRVFATHSQLPRFALLAPLAGDVPGYCLYLQGDAQQLTAVQDDVAFDVEQSLRENPYYRQAVGLRQLRPLEVRVLDAEFDEVWQVYERACLARGTKLGQIKPCRFDPWTGWNKLFSRFECRRAAREEYLPGNAFCSLEGLERQSFPIDSPEHRS